VRYECDLKQKMRAGLEEEAKTSAKLMRLVVLLSLTSLAWAELKRE
jgi:hypothetical protein